MQLLCNGIVIDDDLNLRLSEDEVDKLFYILLNARINLEGDSLYEKEYAFCGKLLDVVIRSRRERMKRGK